MLKRILPAVALFAFMAQPAAAATYTVTSTSWDGAGSLSEAIASANANPGPDTIEFTPGLTVNIRSVPPIVIPPLSAWDYVIAKITDSLVIEGRGGGILGAIDWFNSSGVQSFGVCPEVAPGTLIINRTPGLFALGTHGADNSAIELTMRDLTIRKVNHVAVVEKNASLVMENADIDSVYTVWRCAPEPIIGAYEGASVTLRGSRISNYWNWNTVPYAYSLGPIQSKAVGAGDLTIEDTAFASMRGAIGLRPVTVFWLGEAGSKVDIVSSQFSRSGGIWVGGDAETNIVNSFWNNDILEPPKVGEKFVNSSTGDMGIVASTMIWSSDQCDLDCQAGGTSWDLVQVRGDGDIRLDQSALGFNFTETGGAPSVFTLVDAGPGQFSADEFAWVQPTAMQNAAALRIITAQPALRTGLPAFDHPYVGSLVTELVHPAIGGVLIDQVTDAGPGGANELLHPVTGLPILVDVLGKPRVDANGNRNIGAVQLTLAPHLNATGIDGATPRVRLDWTRPDAPGLTGYEVCWDNTPPPDPGSIGSTCPGINLVPVPDPDTLTFETPVNQGQQYWFLVRGTSGETLPWSNIALATAYGELTAPAVAATPGDGVVALSWTPPTNDGGAPIVAYVVSYREAGTSGWSYWPHDSGATSANIGGLINGLEYEFRVQAVNSQPLIGPGGLANAIPQAPLFVQYATPVLISELTPLMLYPTYGNLIGTPSYSFSGAAPPWLSIDPASGVVQGTPPALGSDYTGVVTVELTRSGPPADSARADIEIQVLASSQGPYLTYVDHTGPAGAAVSLTPTVAGLTPPYTFTNTNNNLPPGLSLTDPASGVIDGIPTTVGFWNVEMRVVDAANQQWNNPVEITITPTLAYPAVSGTVGTALSVLPVVPPLQAGASYSYTLTGGLPSGLVFESSTGEISGTPTVSSSTPVDVEVSVTLPTGTFTAVTHVLLTIADYPVVFNYPQQTAVIGQPFSLVPTVSGTIGSRVFSFDGPQPSGVTLNPDTGELSGIMRPDLVGLGLVIKLTDQYSSNHATALLLGVSAPAAIPALGMPGFIMLALMIVALGWWMTAVRSSFPTRS